jgi:5-methyltetrahydrofolate--homocysteine methyltransferase
MFNFQEISDALIEGNAKRVAELTNIAIGEKVPPKEILEKALLPGLNVIGIRFKNNECFVPEVMVAARAMNSGMAIIKPFLAKKDLNTQGKVVIGTVAGDLHDIGKNLVGIMLEGSGFEVIDLGIDVTPEKFVETVKTQHPKIVAMSALLTTTMGSMKSIIEALEKSGLRKEIKIMIGGAPITQRYADQIGADGFAPDAASSVETAKQLVLS